MSCRPRCCGWCRWRCTWRRSSAAFSAAGLRKRAAMGDSRAACVALLVLVLSLAEVRYPILPITLVHLAAFTVLAMLCHTRLAESRPDAAHLTDYFVCVSLGGVLGGAAAALVAPAVFSSILEYPLAMRRGPPAAAAKRRGRPHGEVARRALAWRGGAAVLLVAGYWACPPSTSARTRRAHVERAVHVAAIAHRRREIAQRVLRASFAIPAVLLLLTPRTALLFAGADRRPARRRGRRQNRRRGARTRAHVLRRAPGHVHSERRLARADARHDDARRAGGSRQGARPAHRLLPSLRPDRRRGLHARA